MAQVIRHSKVKTGFQGSDSVWNYALSPGWTHEEVAVLKACIQKFGLGRWTAMVKAEVLPSKNIQQCYLQTQKLLGQQSLKEFMGLHLDIQKIWERNTKKKGLRKNGAIVNEGDKLTREKAMILQAENKEKYGLSPDEVEAIKLPPRTELSIYNV